MFEYIQGTLTEKEPSKAIVDAGGIGYKLQIPLSTFHRLPDLNSSIRFFLSHIVREDSEALYAFLTKEERDLFETVLNISGIGPKTAIAIIGHMDILSFQKAIAAADIRLLSKIPGIGKKTAERLVIEMRDKFQGKGKKTFSPAFQGNSLFSDALSALLNLGYAPRDAEQAIQKALEDKKDEKDLGRLIAAALQQI